MKKLILLFVLLLLIITGCNNNSSIYGKVDGEKYTNEKYGFSMNIPKDWEANPDTEKINDKEIKVLEFSNNLIYLTQMEDNKILCIDATYLDKSKDKILNSFDSISFN